MPRRLKDGGVEQTRLERTGGGGEDWRGLMVVARGLHGLTPRSESDRVSD